MAEKCKKCKYYRGHWDVCGLYGGCDEFKMEAASNGDRIRSMSDEELVDEFIRIYNKLPNYSDSWSWLREWIKQEREEK